MDFLDAMNGRTGGGMEGIKVSINGTIVYQLYGRYGKNEVRVCKVWKLCGREGKLTDLGNMFRYNVNNILM